MLPVDGEAEEAEIEFVRLGDIEDAHDRHGLLEGDAAGVGGLLAPDPGGKDVPGLQPELAGDDLQRLAVGDGQAAFGKGLAHGFGHGFRVAMVAHVRFLRHGEAVADARIANAFAPTG